MARQRLKVVGAVALVAVAAGAAVTASVAMAGEPGRAQAAAESARAAAVEVGERLPVAAEPARPEAAVEAPRPESAVEPSRPGAAAEPARREAAAAERVRPAAAAADAAADHARPLLELVTVDKRGRFFTLDTDEARSAERDHGFTPTEESAGITMFETQVPGSVPVHRLRLRTGHQAYLLSSDPREIARLSNSQDANRQFDDEGVTGFVHDTRGDGLMELVRYARNGDWRVARADRADLLAAGFTVDGPLGYVPRG